MSAGIVAVDELARAYRAAASGEFRGHARSASGRPGPSSWAPGDDALLVLVVGCGGGSGASTVALAVAEAAGGGRVVECCTSGVSGLAAASSAQLGSFGEGWVRGSRGLVLIEHRSDLISALAELPVPANLDAPVTVLDYSGDTAVLLSSAGWLGEIARTAPHVVVAARPTVTGLRRLETAITLFGDLRVHVVLVGLGKRWPRPVEQNLGVTSRRLLAAGRIHTLPHDLGLAFTGPGPDPLPATVITAAADVLASVKGTLA